MENLEVDFTIVGLAPKFPCLKPFKMGETKPRDYSMKFQENIDFLDALLADLQAIPTGGAQKITRDPTDAPPPLPTENGTSRHTGTSLGSNLSELDSLLEDLNTTPQPKGNKLHYKS